MFYLVLFWNFPICFHRNNMANFFVFIFCMFYLFYFEVFQFGLHRIIWLFLFSILFVLFGPPLIFFNLDYIEISLLFFVLRVMTIIGIIRFFICCQSGVGAPPSRLSLAPKKKLDPWWNRILFTRPMVDQTTCFCCKFCVNWCKFIIRR